MTIRAPFMSFSLASSHQPNQSVPCRTLELMIGVEFARLRPRQGLPQSSRLRRATARAAGLLRAKPLRDARTLLRRTRAK